MSLFELVFTEMSHFNNFDKNVTFEFFCPSKNFKYLTYININFLFNWLKKLYQKVENSTPNPSSPTPHPCTKSLRITNEEVSELVFQNFFEKLI